MATGAQTTPLAIEQVEGSAPPTFRLTRISPYKALTPIAIPSPYDFPVEGSPQFRLMRELRWYLEKFLDYPYHPDTIHAGHVLDALKAWGSQTFNAIFERDIAREWLKQANIIQIRSDDPGVLSWPWEALINPKTGKYVVIQSRMERQLNNLDDPPEVGKLPTDRINILLVVARPYENDVSYRSIARPLVDLIRKQNLPAHVDILRPPTFDQLRAHLENHSGYYHLLHFDGHGRYGDVPSSPLSHGSAHQFRAREGCLVFENEDGEADPKSAPDLSNLLSEYVVPAVVLNACQSGTLDDKAEDPFATVATALLQSGMRSVVAMAYSLYVSGAQSFLPSFYARLFKTGSIAEGVRAGRRQMLSDKRRTSPRGPYELEDWLLPVLYQQQPIDFTFSTEAKLETRESRLPPEVLNYRDDYDFIGRDGPILEMERALHLKTPCILLQGLGGVGKTTLARGFLRWLDETGGLDDSLWLDFRDIRSADYVLYRIGQRFYGENFGIAPNKANLIAQVLKEHRVIIVWDNFESAAQNLTNEDRAILGQLLDAIRTPIPDTSGTIPDATRGIKGKVIITSRSSEEWLSPPRRYKLTLGGLRGEERWEYCESVLTDLGLKVDRNDSNLTKLMDQLMGHPLAMRVVLPLLERTSAEKISESLRTNIAALGLSPEGEEGRVLATLHFVELDLPEELKPLMPLVGLHESYLDANYLEDMAQQVDPAWIRPLINRLVNALGSAGLLHDIGNATYELHPLLTSYLRSGGVADEACQRAFVETMARVADGLARLEYHEQRVPFFLFGASFHFALQIAGNFKVDWAFVALTQSIAAFAQNSRDLVEASRLFHQLAEHAATRSNAELEAAAYHQVGRVAEELHDFESARDWYTKCLVMANERGDLLAAAHAYHQMGTVAHRLRDFEAAASFYFESVAINEEQGNLHEAALNYHQLGMLAHDQCDFENARKWYLMTLAIAEKQNSPLRYPITYHQLGRAALAQNDFENALKWYRKAVAINEMQGNEADAAGNYHELGRLWQAQSAFDSARKWYLESLAISEKLGDFETAGNTYHQLGTVAQQQLDFESARQWYLKSLSVTKRQGDLNAAGTYLQLGLIAQEQRDLKTAGDWYLKSLAVQQKLDDLNGAAITYGQLGIVAALEGNAAVSAHCLARAIRISHETKDIHGVTRHTGNFLVTYNNASAEDQQKIISIWHEEGLGPFPTQDESQPSE